MTPAVWIVVWVEGETDRWETFESREEAQRQYDALTALDSTYTASICRPIVSTDYPTEEK
jgi:hypothetical protein